MKNPDDVVYIDMLDDFFWSAKCQGFAIGSTSKGYKWGSIAGSTKTVKNGSAYSIFDTGASALIFPKDYFKRFLNEMFKSMADDEYEINDGYVLTRCYEDFPTLYFMFDNQWITIEPHEYLVDISDNEDKSICVLLMSQGSTDLFVFGLPLFMDYYTIHDDAMGAIGFTPHLTSEKGPLTSGKQPTRVFKSDDPAQRPVSPWSYVITGVFVAAFVSLWIVVIVTTIDQEKYKGEGDQDAEGSEDEDEGLNKKGKMYLWTIVTVAVLMSIGFGLVAFFYLQPLINKWFSKHPDGVEASFDGQEMVNGDEPSRGLFSGNSFVGLCLVLLFAKVFCSKQ